jgi:hypothetical protein
MFTCERIHVHSMLSADGEAQRADEAASTSAASHGVFMTVRHLKCKLCLILKCKVVPNLAQKFYVTSFFLLNVNPTNCFGLLGGCLEPRLDLGGTKITVKDFVVVHSMRMRGQETN